MVVLAAELARRYGNHGVVSIAMNPGNVATPLQKEIKGFQRSLTVSTPLLSGMSLMSSTEPYALPRAPPRNYHAHLGWHGARDGRIQRKGIAYSPVVWACPESYASISFLGRDSEIQGGIRRIPLWGGNSGLGSRTRWKGVGEFGICPRQCSLISACNWRLRLDDFYENQWNNRGHFVYHSSEQGQQFAEIVSKIYDSQ
jgi:hypothetical protein